MLQFMKKFFKDEDGATALEYGLIAALIAVVILVAVRTLGQNLDATFNRVSTEIEAANNAGAT